jgi:hypothetical protein
LKDRPDLELVVRRHPNEVQEVKPGERIYSSGPTEDICMLIHAVDIVLVTSSTVGAQAYLAGVPLISIESSIMSKDTPYADFGMARSAQSLEDLEEVLLDEIACLKTVQTNKVTVQRCEYASATSLACDQAIEMLSSSTCSGS